MPRGQIRAGGSSAGRDMNADLDALTVCLRGTTARDTATVLAHARDETLLQQRAPPSCSPR
jgi:hypothetical protein